ncbi:MAG: PAS domain S-box protein [Oscillatoria sp. PMC 1051.18]|nr:PAS domain S-box protein [Oscillatoria sp. PMC 1050.18]MEC5032575.1 PAS domain S-box protein [Oscillatoria sp. PMC 1051.18]
MSRIQYQTQTIKPQANDEDHFQDFFYLSEDLFCIIDSEGRFQETNPAWERTLGWNYEELKLYSWLELVHPQDVTSGISRKKKFENRYRHKDGSYRWLSWSISRSPTGVTYAVAKDISESKKKYEALVASRTRLYALLDRLPAFLYLQRPDRSVGFYNRRFREIFGETQSKCYCQILPGRKQLGTKAPTFRVFESKTPQTWEWYDDRTGKIYQIYNYPFQDLDGSPLVVEMGLDITATKLAEEKLRQTHIELEQRVEERTAELAKANEQLRAEIAERQRAEAEQLRLLNVLDASLNEIYIFDAETYYFDYANQTALHNLGYSLAQIQQMTPGDIREKLDAITFEELITPLRRGEKEKLIFKTFHRRRDGSLYPVEVHLQLIDRVFLAVVLDITERVKTETELERSQAQLKQKKQLESALRQLRRTQAQLIQSEKMSSLGQMVAGIAHEINNPINFIYGNLSYAISYTNDLLSLVKVYQEEYPEPTSKVEEKIDEIDLAFLKEDFPKLINSMQVGAERIREIVRSLRNFSRLDEAQMKEVDIHEGLDSTLMILQNRLKAKPGHPEIKVIKEYGMQKRVDSYPGQLNQVFMNILSNGIDALEEYHSHRSEEEIAANPPTIRIQTSFRDGESPKGDRGANWLEIRIADNGSGIPKKVQQHLFEPFFTTKPVGKGTGLGLAISYSIIVEKHHGQIKCVSELGKGTEFIIEIPIHQEKRR